MTVARDCLFVNWLLPVAGLEEPPRPLRYELHRRTVGGSTAQDAVLVSAVLFRQQGLRWRFRPALPLLYPQFQLRVCVFDADGTPAVWVRRILVPRWLALAAAWPLPGVVSGARLSLPAPSEGPDAAEWRWSVVGEGAFTISGSTGSPRAGGASDCKTWQGEIDHVRQRSRAYIVTRNGVETLETCFPLGEVWPMHLTVLEDDLLEWGLPGSGEKVWPEPCSAWLCPEIPIVAETARGREVPVGTSVPAPG